METSAPAAIEGREFDLRYYAGLLWRRRLLVVATAIVGAGLGVVVGLIQTPEYRARVQLQIDPPTPNVMTVGEALGTLGGYWQNADFYNTQFRVLRTTTLGVKVVERLKLQDRPPFKGHPNPGALFMSYVGVEPIPETRLVYVSVTHRDPKEAALWANTLADVYAEASIESRVETARKAYEWLQERLTTTQKDMQQAQEKLFRGYGGQEETALSPGETATSTAKLNEDFVVAQSRRIGLEAALKQIVAMREGGQNLDVVPQVAGDKLVNDLNGQLATLNMDMGRLKEKYKEAHPEIQRLRLQIDQLEKAKVARAGQIELGLRAELAQIQKQEAELSSAIDRQRAQAVARGQKTTELEILKKEAQSAASLYDVLLQKLNETDIAASIRSNIVTIIERAAPPPTPIRPQKTRIALAGLLGGLLLGVGLVLGRDYLSHTIRDPEEIERFLHLDVVASVPQFESEDAYLATEAYQSLRTALLFARREDGGQVVLITGTAPQEGKTTTLVNAARLMAGGGERVLVVDGDLRRAQIHHRLGLAREPGLTDHFVQHIPLEDLVRPTRVPNLFALTAGQLPPNPPAVLTRRDWPQLFDTLRGQFDWIFVDSPPLASVTDALLLARHADHVLLVIQYAKVDKKLVKRHLTALRRATPNVLGAVLNALDAKAGAYSSYYYYYDHQQQEQGGAERHGRRWRR